MQVEVFVREYEAVFWTCKWKESSGSKKFFLFFSFFEEFYKLKKTLLSYYCKWASLNSTENRPLVNSPLLVPKKILLNAAKIMLLEKNSSIIIQFSFAKISLNAAKICNYRKIVEPFFKFKKSFQRCKNYDIIEK